MTGSQIGQTSSQIDETSWQVDQTSFASWVCQVGQVSGLHRRWLPGGPFGPPGAVPGGPGGPGPPQSMPGGPPARTPSKQARWSTSLDSQPLAKWRIYSLHNFLCMRVAQKSVFRVSIQGVAKIKEPPGFCTIQKCLFGALKSNSE